MKATTISFKRSIFLLAFTAISLALSSQNLVPNYSFEDYDPCPPGYGNGGSLECAPWINGNQATSDYFNTCATGTDVWIPTNLFGDQPARTGSAYVGCYMRESSIWREYVQAPLNSPCIAGFSYEVSFYVSLADLYCGVENIGAYLSATPPPPIGIIGTFPGVVPQINADLGFITETEEWVLITGCFTAEGGEQYITIGNFYNNANTPLDPDCSVSFASYYYIDDVAIVQGDEVNDLELELGDPVTTCDPYEIDPGVEDVEYHWSDGSNDPTLLVTESGTYALTITAGCGNVGIDSVEVNFVGVLDGVDLGPDEVTICNGEPYTISLDPDDGDYEWQDGSTDAEYTITTSGVYTVSLDDGCDITSDQVEVTFLDLSGSISLGDDAFLCTGDEISFSFDPNLGSFLWQDNSTSSDYTISGPGIYSLTISNVCGSVSDEIEIFPGSQDLVDIGPDELTFCIGETFQIELDPDAGTYEWQDGSTSSSYIISSEGTYAVTLTNNCGQSSDQVQVTALSPPAEFSFGDDTYLCEHEDIVFSFDAGLGDFLWQDNSSNNSLVISTGGIYALTISNNCGEVTDSIEVNAIPTPEIDLGPAQQNLCTGQQMLISFDPLMGDYAWQDGSTSFTMTISEEGLYEVTVSNTCGTASDEMEVIMVDAPVIDLGQDITICPAQLPITLDAGNAMNGVTYLWQDNSTNAQLLIASAGIYSVTVSNECSSVSDQIEVFVQAGNPVVMLPSDQSICAGDTLLLMTNGVVGNYVWQDGSTNSTFMVTNAGTYTLTVSNQCGSGFDSVTISMIEQPGPLDLGSDVSLCPGERYTLHANVAGGNFLWNDMSTADSLIVTSAGIYFLQITNGCNTVSDTVIVSMNNNPPVVNIPDVLNLCNGDSIMIDAGIAGVDYLWNDGSNKSFLSVGTPGNYSVTVSNSCGINSDTTLVMDAGSRPTVSLGANLNICQGETMQLAPVFSDVSTWLWSDGSTGPVIEVSSAGLVIVQVSNQCGVSSDSLLVTMLPAIPSFDLGSDTVLCPGEILTLSINPQGGDILWQDGSSGSVYQVTAPAKVFATLSNECGSATDSLQVAFLPSIPELDLGPDQSLCPGEMITIAPGITGVDYTWQDGSGDSFLMTTVPGMIALTISNDCGASSDTMFIVENTDGPSLDLGSDILGCKGDSVLIHVGILGVTYLWQDGSTGSELLATTSGAYILQVTNACGQDHDTIWVLLNQDLPAPSLGEDTTMCEGVTFSLTSIAQDPTVIQWQDGSQLPVLNVTSPGIYILTETNQCGATSDTIVINFDAAPEEFSLGPDTSLCPGEFLMLFVPDRAGQMTWQDGSHVETMMADQSQTYSLQISNQCGLVSDEINVSINDQTPLLSLDKQFFICPGQSIVLDVTQPFEAQYAWSNGSSLPVVSLNTPGNYSISISSTCGFVEEAIVVLTDDGCQEEIYIPNVFSPNNDGVNDDFEIYTGTGIDVKRMTTHIFDRWGNQVFNSTEAQPRWDGRYRDADLPSGVYGYVIRVSYSDRGEEHVRQLAGDVTILR